MIGKEILNYRIESLIGKGGMGSVYLATNLHINQKVAIKALNDNLADNPAIRERFRQEAESLLALDHPNIVKFLNFVENEDGLFIIMEYIDGVTLEDFIIQKNGLIVEKRAFPIFDQILDAMAYAHKCKTIHRDIKPANIVLTSDKEGDFIVKILDFGIAKIISESDEHETGWIVGTPLYMSPEQVRGEKVDPRSDIYSMGVLLHQMLTGRAPYDSTTLSELEIQNKVVTEPLPRMREYYPKISDKVQKIVDKATQKESDNRFQNCNEFRKAWKKAIIGEQLPPNIKYAAIALLVLLLGGGCWIWDYNRLKVEYYKDYVEQWGVPHGIGELSSSEFHHRNVSYKFEFQKRKLIRLARVNNLGYVVEDGESERQERPINAKYVYRDNSHIETVFYLNRSGKILFKKNYREQEDGKINMVVFEYGDKYGAERILPKGSTNNYVSLSDESIEKGKVSRYLLEFDDNGYLKTLHYANSQNQIVEDAGIYGKKYDRDKKGRVLKEYYLGHDNTIKATSWGLAIKLFKYDDDNWIETAYQGPDGSPAYDDKDGVSIYSLEYDKYGNMIFAWLRSPNRQLMITKKQGCSGFEYKYNDKWQLCQETCLGLDKKYSYSTIMGFVGTKFEYDQHGYVSRRTYIDENKQPVLSIENYSTAVIKNDANGNQIEIKYIDKKNKPIEIVEGYSMIVATYDSLGNQKSFFYHNISNALCLNKEGVAGFKYNYNELNKITQLTQFGTNGKPQCNNDGIYVVKFEYDTRGNEIKRSFYDAAGTKLILSNGKIAGWSSKYDENGNEIERAFFDANGNNVPCSSRYAIWKSTYDNKGNELTTRYYNIGSILTLCTNGNAGKNYKYDERGNTIEEVSIGADGKYLVGHLVLRRKYDKYDNVIEETLFDYKNSPALNSSGYHKSIRIFDIRNQKLEERYFGIHNELVGLNHTKVAIYKYKYDSRGLILETDFFGTDNKPVIGNEGYAQMKNSYDAMGRVVRQTYFNEIGMPTSSSVMVPEGICKYDKWGNRCYIAAADGHGHLIDNPKTGYAIEKYEYDIRGNKIMTQYFDAHCKPKLVNGYSQIKAKYNNDNRVVEYKYYDEKGNLQSNDYAIARFKYNASGEKTEEAYFDYKDMPCETKNKYHKIIYEYDSNGKLKYSKYYKKNGSSLGVLDSEGKLVSSTGGTTHNSKGTSSDLVSLVSQIKSKCPIQIVNGLTIKNVIYVSKAIAYVCQLSEYSKYQLDNNELADLINNVKSEARKSKYVDVLLSAKIAVYLIVNDKADRFLFKINY